MSIVDRLVGSTSAQGALRRGVRLTEQGQVNRAFPLLMRAATSGIAEAEFRVGRCYLEGIGVPGSRAQGARWLERAGNQGYVEAQALLATLCIHGYVGDGGGAPGGGAGNLFSANVAGQPDFVAAEKWARRAAEGGSADGQALLGFILTSGPETQRNLDEAQRWYQQSAAAGCPQGHLGYALSLARSSITPEMQAQIVEHLGRASEAGLPTALYLLGVITERGLGITANPAAAAQLYRLSAEKGHREAQARWGVALLEGRGIPSESVGG